MQVRPFWAQSWQPMPPDPHAMSCVPCTQRSPTQHPVGQLLASQPALTGVTQAPPAALELATHVPPPVAGLQLSHCMPPEPHAPAWRPSVHTSVPRQHPGQAGVAAQVEADAVDAELVARPAFLALTAARAGVVARVAATVAVAAPRARRVAAAAGRNGDVLRGRDRDVVQGWKGAIEDGRWRREDGDDVLRNGDVLRRRNGDVVRRRERGRVERFTGVVAKAGGSEPVVQPRPTAARGNRSQSKGSQRAERPHT